MAQSTITSTSPGNIVVPLSTIIDQLKSKLSTSEIDALLFAIVSKKQTEVRPGDLITADLVNQILSDVADLETRVAQLEGGQASSSALVLTLPNNGDQFQVGQDLPIVGANLGVSTGSAVVTFNGVLATTFRPGATDQRLTVLIPNIVPLDPAGSSVALVVSNGQSSAQRFIVVRPAEVLAGAIDVVWTGVTPNPIVPGQAATFNFNLSSRANMDATFTVTPTVSRVANAASWPVSLLGGNNIRVPSGGTATARVQINPVPSVDVGTTFALSLGAHAGAVSGGSGRVRLVTGTTVELPDTSIVSAIDSVTLSPVGSGSFIRGTDADTIHVASPATAVITLVASVHQVGTYLGHITPLTSPEAPTANWTLTRHPQDPADPNSNASMFVVNQAQLDGGGGTFTFTPRFVVTPQPTASAAGEAEIWIERQGSGLKRSIVVSLTTSPS
jgi:hypothetical protein